MTQPLKPLPTLAAAACVLALSACTVNRTPYTFNQWEQRIEDDGVIVESMLFPLRRDAGFTTEIIGASSAHYRAINTNDDARCVTLTFHEKENVNVRSTAESPVPVAPAQVLQIADVQFGRGTSSMRADFNVKRAYKGDDGYQCTPPASGDNSCYITTAMCEQTGKPDDCAELAALRDYRDRILTRTEEGRGLVAEYYATAPRLVAAIERDPAREAVYRQLREQYIVPSARAARRGDNVAALKIYKDMVAVLDRRYL